MEPTSRPYRFRRNPIQRLLWEAREESGHVAHMDNLAVRDRLPGWHMRRLMQAAALVRSTPAAI